MIPARVLLLSCCVQAHTHFLLRLYLLSVALKKSYLSGPLEVEAGSVSLPVATGLAYCSLALMNTQGRPHSGFVLSTFLLSLIIAIVKFANITKHES